MVEPYITRDTILSALGTLLSTSENTDAEAFGGLLHLQVIESAINTPDFPPIEQPREFAIQNVLTDLISKNLDDFRTSLQLSPISEETTLESCQRLISYDVKIGNKELLAWSVLFHRYVQTRFIFSFETLAEMFGLEVRTCRRYLNYGVKLLTRELSFLEQSTRRTQRSLSLNGALPTRGKTPAHGRDEIIDRISNLCMNSAPSHVLVTGVQGIGKTTIVERVAKSLIDKEQIDRVLWLSACPSVEHVRRMIVAGLRNEAHQISIRAVLAVYKTIIVLDDCAKLFTEPTALASLFADLAEAIVLLTSDEFSFLPSAVSYHFQIREVDFAAALRIVENTLKGSDIQPPYSSSDIGRDLYDVFGGHPLALRVAATRWADVDWDLLEHDVVDQVLARTFDHFEMAIREAWCVFALYGGRGFSVKDRERVWGETFGSTEIQALVSHMLIQIEHEDCYVMLDAARLFVRRMYDSRADVHATVDRLIEYFLTSRYSYDAPSVMLNIAASDWIKPYTPQVVTWLHHAWEHSRDKLNAAEWLTLFDYGYQLGVRSDIELDTAYAICLRRLGELDEANRRFGVVVLQCGKTGFFDLQAAALVEWALAAALSGNYATAEDLLNQAKRSRLAERDPEFRRRVILTSTQLALERQDGRKAFDQLSYLSSDIEVQALLAEACLLVGDMRLALQIAEQALPQVVDKLAMKVRLYTVLGRCREKAVNLDMAHRYFAEALLYAQHLGDRFSMARAQVNLAAVMLARGKFIEANELLAQAAAIQEKLGDSVGLQINAYNRQLLTQRVAG